MILLLDAGNSRIKWGLWRAGEWHERGAVPSSEPGALQAVLARTTPRWAAISCVAGDEVRACLAAMLDAAKVRAVWLQSAAKWHGLVNRYEPPESLGVDRYAALIACYKNGYAPCVVVSAGTALTVDVLAGHGEFLGGMILPGAALMARMLSAGTAGVAMTNGDWQLFPRSTGAAVATGIWTAISAVVVAMHGRLTRQSKATVTTVLTGGDAGLLAGRLAADALSGPVVVDEYLILEGLLWLARDLDVPGV